MEADVVQPAEGNILDTWQQGWRDSAGVKEQGMQALRSPRNLGGPVISVQQITGKGSPEIRSRLMVGRYLPYCESERSRCWGGT